MIFQYRLLLESLKKATPQEKGENIRAIEVTIKSFDEVYSYLNQTKADQESLNQIEGVINTLNGGIADIDLKKCGRFIRFLKQILIYIVFYCINFLQI